MHRYWLEHAAAAKLQDGYDPEATSWEPLQIKSQRWAIVRANGPRGTGVYGDMLPQNANGASIVLTCSECAWSSWTHNRANGEEQARAHWATHLPERMRRYHGPDGRFA